MILLLCSVLRAVGSVVVFSGSTVYPARAVKNSSSLRDADEPVVSELYRPLPAKL
jgi:hypothetical protein